MSPIGGSRHYGGGSGNLGSATIWNCPACGKQNEGRKPEQGCALCGAGDPNLSKAGTAVVESEPVAREARPSVPSARQPGSPVVRSTPPALSAPPSSTTIYRLIEYVFKDAQQLAEVLRPSLVGKIEMGWGTITATIVDSLDSNQEDRLRMARMQPGVWLANQEAMYARVDRPPLARMAHTDTIEFRQALEIARKEREQKMEMPDAPAFTSDDEAIARNIVRLWGLKFAHTLALALSNIAPELAANSEPEKFMSESEALAIAEALMAQIPDEWQGDHPPTEEQIDAD